MPCPNCHQPMTKKVMDTITVDHCDFCGGTFFDMYEINRISASTAEKLKKLMKSASISGETKMCPTDQSTLKPVEQESVPENTTLLRCEKCGGIFTFPDDLVRFKKAQSEKINYLSAWYKPAPAVSKLFVLSLAIAIISGIAYSAFFTRNAGRSSATDFCTPQVTLTQDATVVYCSTDYQFQSFAIFVNTTTNEQISRTINTKPSTIHTITVPFDDINPNLDVCVKMRLSSGGTSTDTTCVPLQP